MKENHSSPKKLLYEILKDIISKYGQNKMAKGGVTFDDKVTSISKRLLKGKKHSFYFLFKSISIFYMFLKSVF